MKLFSTVIALTGLFAASVQGATSFAGTNLYYAAGLSSSQRTTYFAALQKAGMKVLRCVLTAAQTTFSLLRHPIVAEFGSMDSLLPLPR